MLLELVVVIEEARADRLVTRVLLTFYLSPVHDKSVILDLDEVAVYGFEPLPGDLRLRLPEADLQRFSTRGLVAEDLRRWGNWWLIACFGIIVLPKREKSA